MLEGGQKRDHRKIGREMNLFMMRDGPRLPVLPAQRHDRQEHAAGLLARDHHKASYVEISTPLIMNKRLWKTSSRWDHYKGQHVLTVIDDEEYCIKPMNCPGVVYASKPHSYRELPIRAGGLAPGAPPRAARRPARPVPRALL